MACGSSSGRCFQRLFLCEPGLRDFSNAANSQDICHYVVVEIAEESRLIPRDQTQNQTFRIGHGGCVAGRGAAR